MHVITITLSLLFDGGTSNIINVHGFGLAYRHFAAGGEPRQD